MEKMSTAIFKSLRLSNEDHDKRPLRLCVRVIIRKDGKIALGKKYRTNGEFICYSFVGGGVESGDTMEETVVKECLEEVGIRVKNIHKLNTVESIRAELPNAERAKIYSGAENHYFVADFSAKNTSVHGSDGDALEYEWVHVNRAISLITQGPPSEYNAARLAALEEIKRV